MAQNSPVDRVPESEKLRMIDMLLNGPWSPIPAKLVPSFTKEDKLHLYNELAELGRVLNNAPPPRRP